MTSFTTTPMTIGVYTITPLRESGSTTQLCGHCGLWHGGIGICPRIKGIEYYPDGTVKRIEYFEGDVA